jgi:hypothetical protein
LERSVKGIARDLGETGIERNIPDQISIENSTLSKSTYFKFT